MCPWAPEGLSLRSVPLLWDVVGLLLRIGVVFIIGGNSIRHLTRSSGQAFCSGSAPLSSHQRALLGERIVGLCVVAKALKKDINPSTGRSFSRRV